MYKIKKYALVFALVFGVMFNAKAFADGVGFIDYKKVQENFTYAQTAVKEVDAKGLELQQFLVDKEKEYKTLDTPFKKQNFEQKTKSEFETRQSAYLKFKMKKEEEVYNKIQTAARQVLVEQKLDAVLDFRVIFVGGIDVTDLVIAKLKGTK